MVDYEYNEQWSNRHTSLFDTTNTQVEYLDNINVSIFEFDEDVFNRYVKCFFILSGEMPSEYLLKADKEKRNFDITSIDFGPRNKYNKNSIIMKLRDCILINKTIDNIIASNPNDVEIVEVWAEFSGLVKVIL